MESQHEVRVLEQRNNEVFLNYLVNKILISVSALSQVLQYRTPPTGAVRSVYLRSDWTIQRLVVTRDRRTRD
jgi:hypothetical protein